MILRFQRFYSKQTAKLKKILVIFSHRPGKGVSQGFARPKESWTQAKPESCPFEAGARKAGMFKGIEGMALKYIAMMLIAALVVAAFVQVTGMMVSLGTNGTVVANQTLQTVLDQSLGNVIKGNITP